MTTTLESGRHVTPERIRADGANVERDGFRLMYECPLAATDEERRARRTYWTAAWYQFHYVPTTLSDEWRMA